MLKLGAAIVLRDGAGRDRRPFAVAVRSGAAGVALAVWRGRASGIPSASTSSDATSWRACWPARGSRFSSSLVVVSVSSLVGTLLGAIAGYFGGIPDELISRVTDILLAFPGHPARDRAGRGARAQPGQRAVRADDYRLGRLRAPGARPGAARARVRVRPGGAGARGDDAARAAAAHHPDGAAGGGGAGHARAWPAPFSARRRSAFSASACSRRRRAGARCSTAAGPTCSMRRT